MARSKAKPTPETKANTPASPPPPTWDERVINTLLPYWKELAAGLLALLGVLLLVYLPGASAAVATGVEGIERCPIPFQAATVADDLASCSFLGGATQGLFKLMGWGAYPLSLTIAVAGLHLLLRRFYRPLPIRANQVLGFELMLLAALPLSYLLIQGTMREAYMGKGGGLLGWALAEPLQDFLGPVLTVLLHVILLLWGVALLRQVGWDDVIRWLTDMSVRLQRWARQLEPDVAPVRRVPPVKKLTAEEARDAQKRREKEAAAGAVVLEKTGENVARPRRRHAGLPPLTVLEEGKLLTLSKAELDDKRKVIEQTLLDFGLPGTVTEVRSGPAVTQFGVEPGYIERPGPDGAPKMFKVRVGQIAALQKDLTLSLAAPRLRIEAPVPGRGIVGIEVPNGEISVVRMKAIIQSEAYQKLKSPLAVALGRDVAGAPMATDLGKLPHLLIAGTTGSGKSVAINALITCLVFNNTPEQLKLVLIDPKKVELIRFNGLPHLLGKVETDGERVIGVLRWLTAEMDRRYETFAALGAKHLQDYNRKVSQQKAGNPLYPPLPHMAIFIDELADLMALYPGDVERALCRLAQMARATGMHLVVATQRPSTDVITGLIKANFPARASFAVASGVDSRVILDSVGAEQLLGKGDMLFLPPDASAPMRVQGCFVSDREIEAIVSHWQKGTDMEAAEAPWEQLIAKRTVVGETDDMLEQAIALAQKYDTISTSLLQRRLRTGYPRAARIMEALYEMGMVEDPKEGGRTRKTFVSDEDQDPLGDYISNKE
jgi:S-DNA-T family DNA segregation ATPase FtsK/SpoIIIE